MPRRNNRNTRPQARRKADGSTGRVTAPPPPVESMVIPHGKCYFHNRRGKYVFVTEDEAKRALAQAQHARRRKGTGHKESRYYPCPPGGCGGFHLTSREEYQERSEAS